jgi:RND family efflux transporter MFP subunit
MNLRTTLLSAVGIALVTGACGKTPEASDKTAAGESGAPIKVTAVEVRSTSESGGVEIPAAIESSRRAVLTSRLAASVVELNPREGDVVNAGAVLVRLEDTALRAALSAAEATDQAAARDLKRAETLLAKGAATRNEVENAATSAERTRSAVVAAREALSHASVRAPFTGRILRKLANAGDVVNPGQPLLEIEGAGGLEVVASVEGSIHDRLRVGQKIDVRLDGVEAPFAATIHDLAASADPSTHRFTLRADIAPAPGVRAGLFARILVSSPGGEPRVLVPSGAILRRGGLTGVYVVRDGHAWLRWIAPGDAFGDSIEVRAGLDAKERVALEPSRLHDGAPVSEDRQ